MPGIVNPEVKKALLFLSFLFGIFDCNPGGISKPGICCYFYIYWCVQMLEFHLGYKVGLRCTGPLPARLQFDWIFAHLT